jgi:hypothetical protein
MALYPILETLPFSWIKRSEDAKTIITSAARELIELNKRTGGRERDILGCMVEENRRLQLVGEHGLTDDEMIYQILTFLGAGYISLSFPLCCYRARSSLHAFTLSSFFFGGAWFEYIDGIIDTRLLPRHWYGHYGN